MWIQHFYYRERKLIQAKHRQQNHNQAQISLFIYSLDICTQQVLKLKTQTIKNTNLGINYKFKSKHTHIKHE